MRRPQPSRVWLDRPARGMWGWRGGDFLQAPAGEWRCARAAPPSPTSPHPLIPFVPSGSALRWSEGGPMADQFDPVTLEILWNRLISIADESAAALLRTSFSTIVRESNDFTTV